MPFYIYAWIASISYAIVVILSKYLIKNQVKNPWIFLFFWYLATLLLTLPVALVNGAKIPTQWGYVMATSLFFTLADIGYVAALKKLDVSTIAPLFNLRIITSAILAALILGETYQKNQYWLMLVIVVGAMLVTLDEHFKLRSFFQKPVAIMLGVVTALTLSNICLNRAIEQNDYWTVTLWTAIFGQIFVAPLLLKDRASLKQVKLNHLGVIGIMGIFGAIGTLANNKAIQDNVSLSAAIISIPLSMVLAIIISLLKPDLLERNSGKVYLVRIIGAFIMFAAVLKLTLG